MSWAVCTADCIQLGSALWPACLVASWPPVTRSFQVLLCVAVVGPGTALRAQSMRADRYDSTSRSWSPLRGPGAIRWNWEGAVVENWLGVPFGVAFAAGNPAALPFDVTETATRFDFKVSTERGSLRGATDPGTVEVVKVAGSGWRLLGGNGVVVGSAELEQVEIGAPAHINTPGPGVPTPILSFDTSGSALRELSVRLQGMGGWKLKQFALGIGAGLLGTERRTARSPTPRRMRATAAGVVAGAAWQALSAPVTLGVQVRHGRSTETALINTVAAGTRIYHVWGFAEPVPLDLTTLYYRRIQRTLVGAGVSVAGHGLRTDWVVSYERSHASDRQSSIAANDPPADAWKGYTTRVVAAIRRPSTRVLSIRVERETSAGDVTGFDSEYPAFHHETSLLRVDTNLGVPITESWVIAGGIGFDLLRDFRTDDRVQIASDLDVWRPRVQVDVARQSNVLGLAGRVWAADLAPTGTIPDPSAMGPLYGQLVAPELGLMSLPQNRYGGSVLVSTTLAQWNVRLGLGWATTSGRRRTVSTLQTPRGSRRVVSVGLRFESLR